MGKKKRPKRGSGVEDEPAPQAKRFASAAAPVPAPISGDGSTETPAAGAASIVDSPLATTTTTTMQQQQQPQHQHQHQKQTPVPGTAPFCWWKPLAQLVSASSEARALLADVMANFEPPAPGHAVTVPTEELITALHAVLLATPAPLFASADGARGDDGCGSTVLPLLHAYRAAMIPILASCIHRRLGSQAGADTGQASPMSAVSAPFNLREHERIGYTFTFMARLMSRSDHVMLLLEDYYLHAPSPFERILRSAQSGGSLEPSLDEAGPYLDIARTANNLLAVGYRGGSRFSWAPLFALLRCGLLTAPDPAAAAATGAPYATAADAWAEVRWYAARCVAQLLSATRSTASGGTSSGGAAAGLSCSRLAQLSRAYAFQLRPPPSFLRDEEIVAAEHALACAADIDGDGQRRDRPRLQAAELAQWVQGLTVVSDTVLPTSTIGSHTTQAGQHHHLQQQRQQQRRRFIATEACQDTLRAVAMAMAVGKPVILEGPPGTGKTALLDELARRCGQYSSLIRIHLDDQLDSKILLGSYTCTEEPGQFKWQPGALTQAVRGGRWIIFEDIHCAPFELLAALKPLLEDRVLFVAGRGERIPAAAGFQLFATQTVNAHGGGGQSKSASGGIFGSLFTHVRVGLLPPADMFEIMSAK